MDMIHILNKNCTEKIENRGLNPFKAIEMETQIKFTKLTR